MTLFLSLMCCVTLITPNVLPAFSPAALYASSSLSYTEDTTEVPAEDVPANETTTTENQAETPSPNLSISAPSAILMEASTGTILYEKDAHVSLHPASITKIMTLILIFDALSTGQIKLEDTVTVSEHAASMGGSQVFLETGETQDVNTMIKCISVASANDACVAY